MRTCLRGGLVLPPTASGRYHTTVLRGRFVRLVLNPVLPCFFSFYFFILIARFGSASIPNERSPSFITVTSANDVPSATDRPTSDGSFVLHELSIIALALSMIVLTRERASSAQSVCFRFFDVRSPYINENDESGARIEL